MVNIIWLPMIYCGFESILYQFFVQFYPGFKKEIKKGSTPIYLPPTRCFLGDHFVREQKEKGHENFRFFRFRHDPLNGPYRPSIGQKIFNFQLESKLDLHFDVKFDSKCSDSKCNVEVVPNLKDLISTSKITLIDPL